jgi:PAS domain S-box-containing protein
MENRFRKWSLKSMNEKMNNDEEKTDELRKRAEEIDQRNNFDSEIPEQISEEVTYKLFHELRVHQIELELQNEELRRTQEELEISRERYFNLYDMAPVGYCTINKKNFVLETNLTAATMLCVIRSFLVKQPLTRFILKEDQDKYYLFSKKIFETENPDICEIRMVRQNGMTFWVRIEAATVHEIDDNVVCRIILSDITVQKEAEEKINILLKEKELLLKEVYHRVKNNMNTISALINLQLLVIKEPSAVLALKDTANRVHSIMVLFDKLNNSVIYEKVSVKEYIQNLADEIINNFPNSKSITVEKQISDFILSGDKLLPIGLIINELLTNIMKYAFIGKENGLIKLSAAENNNTISFIIQDNGTGIPESIDFKNSKGFGLRLVAKRN